MKTDEIPIEQDSHQLSLLSKRIIVLFCTIHGLVLLVSIFPIERPPHSTLLSLMKPYHELTGTSQDWRLFRTIPRLHSISVKTKIFYLDGHVEERGAVLPSMKFVNIAKNSRYFYLIQRIVTEDWYAKYRDAWQAKIAEKMKQERIRSFEVEVESQAIRHLFHIAKDRNLYKPLIDRFGTYGITRENY